MRLGTARSKVSWVNIWQDPTAAAHVAHNRNGNETVPTAMTGSGRLLPSSAEAIREHLGV